MSFTKSNVCVCVCEGYPLETLVLVGWEQHRESIRVLGINMS